MIKGLKFAGIPTRDQNKAVKFWTEKIGFRVMTDQPMGNQRWIELHIGTSPTGIVLFTPEATKTGSAPSSTAHSCATT